MIRRVLGAVVVLAALLVGVDRGAAYLVSRAVAARVRTVAGAATAGVDIRGFPFLTQLLAGDLARVDVAVRGVRRGGLEVSSVAAQLSGVHVDLARAVRGRLRGVRVDGAAATAFVSFADIGSSSKARALGLTVRPAGGGRVAVSGSVHVLGQRISASGDATLAVSGTELVIAPAPAGLTVGHQQLPAGLGALVSHLLVVHLDLSGLPFGLRPRGVAVTSTGIVVSARTPAAAAGSAVGLG